jgi:hypothetical protein
MVSTRTDELDRAESAIVQVLRQNGRMWAPVEVIEQLKSEGWSEDLVRVAIWYLIDRTDVVLTLDWKLALPERAHPAA